MVNVLFMDHFQRLAEGHFVVRRLERLFYGPATVRAHYDAIAAKPAHGDAWVAGRGVVQQLPIG